MSEIESNPYVGPRPFGEEDAPVFFGRGREARELVSLVISHPAVLLYAESGAGKTSLLHARMIPDMRLRGTDVIGAARVGGEIPHGLSADAIRNRFVFNALVSLEKDLANPGELAQISISQYLAARPKPTAPAGPAAHQLLVFDQFEEIFTTCHERWQDRATFFDDLGDALEANPMLRVVLAIREDYLALLDAYADTLPERLRTRMRLERLREDAALLAVTEPLKGTRRTFDPTAAAKLVANLLTVPVKTSAGKVEMIRGEFVEPVQLQVVCQDLWAALDPTVVTIEEKHIAAHADVDQALGRYYQQVIEKVVARTGVRDGELRRWFDRTLITPAGTRGTVYQDAELTGGLANKVVCMLEDLRLVRPELRAGARWYELTHDRLIGPIRASNAAWSSAHSSTGLKGQALEARAQEWKRAPRADHLLLSANDLALATRWLSSAEAQDVGVSEVLKEFVQASERERISQLHHSRAALAALAAAAIVGSIFLYRAVMVAKRAESETRVAMLSERGRVASLLAGLPGKEFLAVAFGVQAAGGQRTANEDIPPEATRGLAVALQALGDAVWLRSNVSIEGIELAPDGTTIATWAGNRLRLWDAGSGSWIEDTLHGNYAWRRVWYTARGSGLIAIATDTNESPGRRPGVTAMAGPVLHVFDPHTGKRLGGGAKRVTRGRYAVVAANGTRLVAYGIDDHLRVYDARSGESISALPNEFKLRALDISPDGSRIVTITSDGAARLWSTDTGRLISALRLGGAVAEQMSMSYWLAFSSDGSRFVIARGIFGSDSLVSPVVFATPSGTKLLALPGVPLRYPRLQFSRDDKHIVAIDEPRVWVWKAQARSPVKRVEMPEGKVEDSHGGLLLMSDAEEEDTLRSTIWVWDPISGDTLVPRTGVQRPFDRAAISDDMGIVLTVDRDQLNAHVWKLGQKAGHLDGLSRAELLALGCRRLRQQPEWDLARGYCPVSDGSPDNSRFAPGPS